MYMSGRHIHNILGQDSDAPPSHLSLERLVLRSFEHTSVLAKAKLKNLNVEIFDKKGS